MCGGASEKKTRRDRYVRALRLEAQDLLDAGNHWVSMLLNDVETDVATVDMERTERTTQDLDVGAETVDVTEKAEERPRGTRPSDPEDTNICLARFGPRIFRPMQSD